MGKRIPFSGKAKKAQLQQKRQASAVDSSGDRLPPPERTRKPAPRRRFGVPTSTADRATQGRRDVALSLESRFLKLPASFDKVSTITAPLERPIDDDTAVLGLSPDSDKAPTCPKRPKWRYTHSKLEVEKNEEGTYARWLAETDAFYAPPQDDLNENLSLMQRQVASTSTKTPSFFERNLEVWRQLWRVTERSSILLLLLDARCPPFHYPASLRNYVQEQLLGKGKRVIFVLTKCDLVRPVDQAAWKAWLLREHEGNVSVVGIESYKEVERRETTQGTAPRFAPSASSTALEDLIDALRSAHDELTTPPMAIKDPERRKAWRPRVRERVDWDRAMRQDAAVAPAAGSEKVDEDDHGADEEQGEAEAGEHKVPDFLTVGLIGQPNVGKSSLINALLGRNVVRASKTPGKTKHFQTIFWQPDLRLCDCPGLVFPPDAQVGMEQQVLASVLPIQNAEVVLAWIAKRLPLEKILPGVLNAPDADTDQQDPSTLTIEEILSRYAEHQKLLTAKAGRPDLYRAGALILRKIQSSEIPWSFVPAERSEEVREAREGILLTEFRPVVAKTGRRILRLAEAGEHHEGESDDYESGEEEEGSEGASAVGEEDESEEGSSDDDDTPLPTLKAKNTFAALSLNNEEDEDEDDQVYL